MKGSSRAPVEVLADLTPLRASVLCAYYGLLREGRAPTWIGAHEVLDWLARHDPDEPMPSESLIQKVLVHAHLPHRGRGRPRGESTAPAEAPPLCAVRASPPRGRAVK